MLDINYIQKIASIAQSGTLALGAVFAAYKFGLFRKWRATLNSEMVCSVRAISGNFVFEAEYKIFNTGDRPLRIEKVTLKLCKAKLLENGHLTPDAEHLIVPRTVFAEDRTEGEVGANDQFKAIDTLKYVNRGADSSFTLRCQLKELPDVAFVVGEFKWHGGSKPSSGTWTETWTEMWVNELSSSIPLAQRTAAGV